MRTCSFVPLSVCKVSKACLEVLVKITMKFRRVFYQNKKAPCRNGKGALYLLGIK